MAGGLASGQVLSPSASSVGSSTPTGTPAPTFAPQAIAARPSTIAIAPKAMATDDAPVQFSPTTNGVTQRDWVIPPRPKPGRKPATDTPPSKRKAQNRAAQRAFRERRAARLNELEEQIKHRDEAKETILMEQVSKITVENNVLRATVAELRKDIEALQKRDAERMSTSPSLSATGGPTSRGHGHGQGSFSSSSTAPSFANTFGSIVSQIASPAPSPRSEAVPCFEEAFGRRCCGGTGNCRGNIDTVSTLSPVPLSRRESQHLEMEIDFTNMFSSSGRRTGANTTLGTSSSIVTPRHRMSVSPSAMSPSPLDSLSNHPDESCGFCSDGTACVCAEMKSMEKETERLRQQNIAREAFMRLQNSRTLPDPTGGKKSKPSGCTGEPGSCAQCQNDPMSTLFCRTLATKKSPSPGNTLRGDEERPGFVCCGGTACGKNPGKDKPAVEDIAGDTEMKDAAKDSLSKGTYIPCSDAYLSLSRHKRFMDADLGTVVKKLNTSGLGVEVSSVKQVLEYLEALESFQNNESRKGSVDASAAL